MAATPGTFQPISLREGITEWSQNVLQGRGRPERRGLGGTDFFYPVKVRSYGVVEHFLAYAVPGWTSRSTPTPLALQGVEGRRPWSSCVALFVTASHVQPVGLMAFDR